MLISSRSLITACLLQAGLLAPAAAACSNTQPYPVTLYDPPGQAGYIKFNLTVGQMVAKMGGYAPLLQNLRYVANMGNNTYGGPDMQQVELTVKRAIAAVAACQQEEERTQTDSNARQQAEASARAATPPIPSAHRGTDPSLYNTEDNSDGNQLFRQMAAAGTPFTPKNPQNDHTGEPCVYFTKPLVRPDGGGLNAYADGSYVAYGKFYYTCRSRRWVSIGLASSFVNVQEHAAERLESTALSTQIYEKE